MTDNPFDIDYIAPDPGAGAERDVQSRPRNGPIYHNDLIQGSDEWLAARCGLLTASEMQRIMTPTLKSADNDKSRQHVWEIAAQRISQYVEPAYISDDMLRGQEDESYARQEYAKHFAPVEEVGFVTNDSFGFTIGYSPDGLVGSDGLIECKSRRQKYQVQTIVDWYRSQTAPVDYLLQCQTGMLVTERKWIDLVSYSGGLPMIPMRIHADRAIQDAIVDAATKFEIKVQEAIRDFEMARKDIRMVPTERRVEEEMYV